MKDTPEHRSRRWFSAGSALLLAVAAGTVALAAGSAPAQAHTIVATDFQQVELARGVNDMGEPMSLAVLPDRSVLHTARNGTLRRTDANGTTSAIGTLSVYQHDEEGCRASASTRASPRTVTSTSTTPRRSPLLAGTRRPPAPTSRPSTE
ncbi:hypothetical protein NKG94_45270 [Micromonospora sp. M12]